MKTLLKKISVLGFIGQKIVRAIRRPERFVDSESYWIKRYISGGTSGAGSSRKLAEYKAEVVNDFVKDYNVTTVIEYGCGDGNQLRLARYPSYLGFDVSPKAIASCNRFFRDQDAKDFKLMKDYAGETAQLTLSLDVIYHLTEDDTFRSYMRRLFDSSERFVIIYSSNFDGNQVNHEKPRRFTDWIEANASQWTLARHVPNKFPYLGNEEEGSLSDFYVYEKAVGAR